MATSPYLPTPVNSPLDPGAPSHLTPAPAPPGYQNTPEGRAAYLQKFAQTPWYNGPLFDSYLQSHPDWTEHTDYWDTRLGDAPGVGSNAAPTPRPMSGTSTDLSRPGSQQSDLFAKVLAELDAQESGGPSPTERDVHLRMLRGH